MESDTIRMCTNSKYHKIGNESEEVLEDVCAVVVCVNCFAPPAIMNITIPYPVLFADIPGTELVLQRNVQGIGREIEEIISQFQPYLLKYSLPETCVR